VCQFMHVPHVATIISCTYLLPIETFACLTDAGEVMICIVHPLDLTR
jgi:hypothetical protein